MKILISIFLILNLILTTSKIKIKIYVNKIQNKLKPDFLVKFEIYLLNLIKMPTFKLLNNKMQFLFLKKSLNKINLDKNTIKNISIIKILKNSKIKFEKIYINLAIGMEDAVANALLVGGVSGFIGAISGLENKKINMKNFYYKVIPIYNKNVLEFDISLEISISIIKFLIFKILHKKSNSVNNNLKM